MLALISRYMAFAMLKYVLLICRGHRAFCINGSWVLPKAFSVSVWMTCDLSPSVHFSDFLHLLICVC